MKIDDAVKRETKYIAIGSVILSVLMESIFLIAQHWSYAVILGNLLGIIAAVGNFFLMGLTVQSAVGLEQKDASAKMKASQTLRMFMLFAIAILGVLAPCFNILAVLISLFFPRIVIMCRSFFLNKEEGKKENDGGENVE